MDDSIGHGEGIPAGALAAVPKRVIGIPVAVHIFRRLDGLVDSKAFRSLQDEVGSISVPLEGVMHVSGEILNHRPHGTCSVPCGKAAQGLLPRRVFIPKGCERTHGSVISHVPVKSNVRTGNTVPQTPFDNSPRAK